MTTKLFINARIHTPVDGGAPAGGAKQGRLAVFDPGAIFVKNGIIERIGPEKEISADLVRGRIYQLIDCKGRCLVPGFVDPHTHMCFAHRREAEFEMRIAGTPYLEILKRGGGILASVRAVREASAEELFQKTLARAISALGMGTTTLEIKSGYGLDVENELKMLLAIESVDRATPLDVVPTFLGAHAVPEEFAGDADGYVSMLVDEMLPAVKAQGIARFCDVFCEKGVFDIQQARRVLEAAAKLGLRAKIHADEVHDLGGASLAADLRAVSADHLLAADMAGVKKMGAAGTVAVLLPATAYSLKTPYAQARTIIDAGVPAALATDCNPGSSYTESMPFVMGLAVMQMDMTPAEALTAATLNAAYAIGEAERVGSLEVGKQADFLILDGQSPAMIAYHAGVNPVAEVFKRGECVTCSR